MTLTRTTYIDTNTENVPVVDIANAIINTARTHNNIITRRTLTMALVKMNIEYKNKYKKSLFNDPIYSKKDDHNKNRLCIEAIEATFNNQMGYELDTQIKDPIMVYDDIMRQSVTTDVHFDNDVLAVVLPVWHTTYSFTNNTLHRLHQTIEAQHIQPDTPIHIDDIETIINDVYEWHSTSYALHYVGFNEKSGINAVPIANNIIHYALANQYSIDNTQLNIILLAFDVYMQDTYQLKGIRTPFVMDKPTSYYEGCYVPTVSTITDYIRNKKDMVEYASIPDVFNKHIKNICEYILKLKQDKLREYWLKFLQELPEPRLISVRENHATLKAFIDGMNTIKNPQQMPLANLNNINYFGYNGFLKIKKHPVEIKGRKKTYEELVMKNASAILVVDEDENIILVEQTRPMSRLKDLSLELPAGMVDEGEDTRETAVREFGEETGITPSALLDVTFICDYHMVIASSKAVCALYKARLRGRFTDYVNPADTILDNQVQRIRILHKDTFKSMLENNELHDPKTIMAALLV